MVDEATKLIIEKLQLLRQGQEETRASLNELHKRITGLEIAQAHGLAQLSHLPLQIANQTGRIDRMDVRFDRVDARLDRIERRLDQIERHRGLVHA